MVAGCAIDALLKIKKAVRTVFSMLMILVVLLLAMISINRRIMPV